MGAAMKTEWGEHAREILRQYNDTGLNRCASLPFHGPHYVVHIRGDFFLRPFGPWADYRHSFECRPEFIPEPLWTFAVLC